MREKFIRRGRCLLAVLTLLLVVGCGKDQLPLGKVKGTVTLDGQPVSGGIVYFVPERGPAASATLDAFGRYRLSTYGAGDGAVLGHHTVYFSPAGDEAYMASYTEADYAAGKPPPEAPPTPFLPARYLSPSSSNLEVEVVAGAQTRDFPLIAK